MRFSVRKIKFCLTDIIGGAIMICENNYRY